MGVTLISHGFNLILHGFNLISHGFNFISHGLNLISYKPSNEPLKWKYLLIYVCIVVLQINHGRVFIVMRVFLKKCITFYHQKDVYYIVIWELIEDSKQRNAPQANIIVIITKGSIH